MPGQPTTPTASTAQVYNDGGIQYGSFIAVINKGPANGGGNASQAGVPRGTYILEGITPNRPTKKLRKPDEIGGPNGSAAVKDVVSLSGIIQMADNTVSRPQLGDWFTLTFDTANGQEYFYIDSLDEPYEMQGYFKSNFKGEKIYFPTYNSTFTPN